MPEITVGSEVMWRGRRGFVTALDATKPGLASVTFDRAENPELVPLGWVRVPTYKIVRHYFRGGKRTIATGLTLAEAQAHCSDPETSSQTCTKSAGRARTRRMGPWFDGYTAE